MYEPALDLYNLNPHSAPPPPIKWTRLSVKRHFTRCKMMSRRKIAATLSRAETLMNLTWAGVRVRNPTTGEVKVQPDAAKLWFAQATSYVNMLLRSGGGKDAGGAGVASLRGQTGTNRAASAFRGISGAPL